MPEFSQIQTYVKCEETTYKNIISKFIEMLTKFGIDKEFLNCELFDLEWEASDDGIVYIGSNINSIPLILNGAELNIKPHIMGWNSLVFPKLTETWLELSLLFETEQIIQNFDTYVINENISIFIWEMIKVFSETFNETGTYFTDEVRDGIPWETLIGEGNDLWSFDGAIIPISLSKYYHNVPSGYKKITTHDKIYLIKEKSWSLKNFNIFS